MNLVKFIFRQEHLKNYISFFLMFFLMNNLLGLKADEDKESYAFNKHGLEYNITWSAFRDDNKPFTEDRQSVRYTKLFKGDRRSC